VGKVIDGSQDDLTSLPKNSDEIAYEEAIQNQVDYLMSLEDGQANSLLPPAARRAKIEHEVRALADFSEFGKTIALAFEILRNEGLALLGNDHDNEILQDSLDKLSEQLEDLELNDLTDDKLKEAYSMSPESKQLILKVGIEKYRHEKFKDSLMIFTLLSTIDDEEPDYWYKLGLMAQKTENYGLAREAFSKTSQLAPDFIGAHVFAAECDLKIGRRGDALTELKKAKECLSKNKSDDWQDQIFEIERMLAESAP
jgi:tetratricopeptide (TPR) repeat protein